MSFRTFLHIPAWLFKAAAVLVLAVLMGYVALTHTQVGRDGLRAQVEKQFNAQYEGTLQIGSLTGNLINDLYATDVRLLDPSGDLVIEVDSVVVRPGWREMMRRQLSIRQLTLFEPSVHLTRHENERWNLAAALTAKSPDESEVPWGFISSDIRIYDGRFQTRNDGLPPRIVREGRLFNYTASAFEDIDLAATIEWGPDVRLIDVRRMSGNASDLGLLLHRLHGQVVLEDDNVSVTRLRARLGESELDISGVLRSHRALRTGSFDEVAVSVDLSSASLDFSELRRILPGLPLRNDLHATAQAEGSLADLQLVSFHAEHGDSRVSGGGRIAGLPHALDYRLSDIEAEIEPEDLYSVYPHRIIGQLREHGKIAVALHASGTLSRTSEGVLLGSADTELTVDGSLGHLDGPIAIVRSEEDSLRYEGELSFANVDLDLLTGDDNLQSLVSGHLQFDGIGHTLDDLFGVVSADIYNSVLLGRDVSSLRLDMGVAHQRLDARLTLHQAHGVRFAQASYPPAGTTGEISSELMYDWSSDTPHYRLDINSLNADLGDLLQSDSLFTGLNAQLAISGRGTSWELADADIMVRADSSLVQWSDQARVVPPFESSMYVRKPSTERPALSVEGDLGTLFLRGDVQHAPLASLSALWAGAIADAVGEQFDKRYRGPQEMMPDVEMLIRAGSASFERDAPPYVLAQREARRALVEAGLDSMNVKVDFHLYRLDILTSMLPMLPMLEGAVQGHVESSAMERQLSLAGIVEAERLSSDLFSSKHAHLDLRFDASLDPAREESVRARMDLQTDSLHVRDGFLDSASLSAHLADREAYFALTSTAEQGKRPLQTEGSIQFHPDHNRLLLDYFEVKTGPLTWRTDSRSVIALYRDAVAVSDFSLQSRHPRTGDTQRLAISGILSDSPDDVLTLDAQQVGLAALSETFLGGFSLGGLANGTAALTNIRAPELTGSMEVEAFSYDNRLLGRLEATSQYIPGQEGIAVNAVLAPSDAEREREYIYGTNIPGRFEENKLEIEGVFNLPELDETGAVLTPSHFDLAFTAEQINAFFFDYLFPDVVDSVEGKFEGAGTITGSLANPVFDASFELKDGYVEIPHFALSYEVAGPVAVDEEGFKLGGITVTDPTGGTASIDGAILFNKYEFFSFDLEAQLNQLLFMNVTHDRDLPFYGQIWASGPATLTGPVYATTLRSQSLTTSSRSELYIPVTEGESVDDPGFIVFADSLEQMPDWTPLSRRAHILADRPVSERSFLDGMDLDLNFSAPRGSTVNLVFDPLLGDVVRAVGSGRIQLQRQEGEFLTYGTFEVSSGDYLFTAGEVFVRRFIIDEGAITWDGDPIDAQLDIRAAYRTRASRAGLSGAQSSGPPIPLSVGLHITGRVSTPEVDLGLRVDQQDRTVLAAEQLQAVLSQPELETEYATSVLLTNSFLLTTESGERDFFAGSAFNSVSQLVSSQLNRYLNEVLPNVDFTFGIQGDENVQDLDVTYGLALRLLDERLIIRGQGVYSGGHTRAGDEPGGGSGLQQQGLQGEFIVELRLSQRVAVEVFYRREGDLLNVNQFTNTTGAGLSYQTRFPSWRSLFRTNGSTSSPDDQEQDDDEPVVRSRPPEHQ